MATQLQDDDQDIDTNATLNDEQQDSQVDHDNDDNQDDDDEIDIGFEGEAAADPVDETPLVKKLRQEIRERDRKIAEAAKQQAPIEVGERPKLEDFDFDEDKHADAVEQWTERKRKAAEQKTALSQQTESQQAAHTAALDVYRARKIAMARPDFDDAEGRVIDALDNTRQALIVHAAEDSAKVIYALGRSQAKLDELAAITDPIKFVAAIAKLEGKITMTPRRKAPAPDVPVRGGAPLSQANGDTKLAKLEKDAAKPGADRTELIRYRRELREKAK